MAQAQKITPRATDFSEWYGDVIDLMTSSDEVPFAKD